MHQFKSYVLHLRGRELNIDHPLIMGILNVTPDSFYADSRCTDEGEIELRVQQMLSEGADMIDIGACSTRPGALEVSAEDEYTRLKRGIEIVRRLAPEMVTSVDTFRSSVAQRCVEELGVDIINDVSGGTIDKKMFPVVSQLQVPYILMHMRGNPKTMQALTNYENGVVDDVYSDMLLKIEELRAMDVNDIICDPGFGFAKTLDQNYELMAHLERFQELQVPVLAGISRKSMISRALNTSSADSLNGTTVLNTIALLKGAHILRVHDVKAAVEARTLVQMTLSKD